MPDHIDQLAAERSRRDPRRTIFTVDAEEGSVLVRFPEGISAGATVAMAPADARRWAANMLTKADEAERQKST